MLLVLPALAEEDIGELEIMEPRPVAKMSVKDGSGITHSIQKLQNKLTAIHFWATWCAPCIEELPEIDEAQQAYGTRGFTVIAVSLDGETNGKRVEKFYAEHGIRSLRPYLDVQMNAIRAAKAPGLPTTLFIDAQGKEIARGEGVLDWKSGEVVDFIESQLGIKQ